jgi:hypothetical protein
VAHGGGHGGGDREHHRRVPIAGEVVPEAPEIAGTLDEPAEYYDEEPGPATEPEPETKPEEEEPLWELGEDGELRCLTKPTG